MADYKPLNPGSKVIDGRLAGVCFFASRVFSEVVPNFRELITVEDRVNAVLTIEAKGKEFKCLTNSMYKGGWSLMRQVGQYKDSDIIVMAAMSSSEERDPVPRRLLVFRVGDVETRNINTSIGPRDATFFNMDKQDEWAQFTCGPQDAAKALRSVAEGVVDPDLPNGPFKSYLTGLLNSHNAPVQGNQSAPANNAGYDDSSSGGDNEGWDDDIPF